MKRKEFIKSVDTERKVIGKSFGFKKSSYASYRIENGYFFALYHFATTNLVNEVRLEVKPMYADDLWWDIFLSPETKSGPISLRATGSLAVDGTRIATYDIFTGDVEKYSEQDITKAWEEIFTKVQKDIEVFLTNNPNPDKYYPEPTYKGTIKPNLLYILALLHNKETEKVHNIISYLLSKGHKMGMLMCTDERPSTDGYDLIIEWCEKTNI